MPVDGFVRSVATMQAFLQQLAEKGVLRSEPAKTVGRDQGKPAAKVSN